MLFTNHQRDTIRAAFYKYTAKPSQVSLACPFFSNEALIKEIYDRGCVTRLIVRLCSATSPTALTRAIRLGTQIRFFTSRYFHSKLYVFGDAMVLVGSANLTDAGMQSNQEIMVGIAPDDPRFEELIRLFQSYWNDAEPLDDRILRTYAAIFQSHKVPTDPFDSEITSAFGKVSPTGIQVGAVKKTKEAIYLSGYRRTYQEFLHAYRVVEALYKERGSRKQPTLPLRIEIDSFFSYIREEFTKGESYFEAPILSGSGLEA